MTPRTRKFLEGVQRALSSYRTKVAIFTTQALLAASAFWNGNMIIGLMLAALASVDLYKLME